MLTYQETALRSRLNILFCLNHICFLQVLSCGDNVLFCGLVHEEDTKHFPTELTDPKILSDIVNFSPNLSARVMTLQDGEGNNVLAPPVEEFMLTQVKVPPFNEASISSRETARTLFVLKVRLLFLF